MRITAAESTDISSDRLKSKEILIFPAPGSSLGEKKERAHQNAAVASPTQAAGNAPPLNALNRDFRTTSGIFQGIVRIIAASREALPR